MDTNMIEQAVQRKTVQQERLIFQMKQIAIDISLEYYGDIMPPKYKQELEGRKYRMESTDGIKSLGNLTVNLGLNITGMARGLKQAQSKMQNFGENISKKSRKIRNFGLGMTATAPIAAVGIASIKAAAQVETMEVAFKTLTGSAEEAKKIMADIATLSKATPFQFSGIGTAAKSLLAFGTERVVNFLINNNK